MHEETGNYTHTPAQQQTRGGRKGASGASSSEARGQCEMRSVLALTAHGHLILDSIQEEMLNYKSHAGRAENDSQVKGAAEAEADPAAPVAPERGLCAASGESGT
jgi:hypothetical protein